MIVLVDPKDGRGGGQVVLEELLARLSREYTGTLALLMSEKGSAAIRVPSNVIQLRSDADLKELARDRNEIVRVVANANRSFPHVVRAREMLRRRGIRAEALAVVHNYPSNRLKGAVTRAALARFDRVWVVEPGLSRLRRDAIIPAWLSLAAAPEPIHTRPARTGVVKSYGRPDRSKGLHLLPSIFGELQHQGMTCRVALGHPLDGQRRYEAELRDSLQGWLEDGFRDSTWIEPGDIFVVPSIAGEAACLSAQEAMSRGAVVVASRIGLMAYLSPENRGIRTFAIGDVAGATDACRTFIGMSEDEFSFECASAAGLIRARAGAWYVEVVSDLLKLVP